MGIFAAWPDETWGNGRSESWRGMPKVLQLTSGRAVTYTQARLQSPSSFQHTGIYFFTFLFLLNRKEKKLLVKLADLQSCIPSHLGRLTWKSASALLLIMKPRGPSKVRVPSQKIPSFPGVGGGERALWWGSLLPRRSIHKCPRPDWCLGLFWARPCPSRVRWRGNRSLRTSTCNQRKQMLSR